MSTNMQRRKSTLIWTPTDFLGLGARSAVDKALQRLEHAHDVRRIDRGLYDLPRINALTGKPSAPDYNAIIEAVARREKARFIPDGITAANQLGLTDAVPARVTIHTDARLRPVHFDKLAIDFKLTAPSRLYWAGRPAMRIVQALHWVHDMLPQTAIRYSKSSEPFWRIQNGAKQFATIFAAAWTLSPTGCGISSPGCFATRTGRTFQEFERAGWLRFDRHLFKRQA